MKGTLAGELTKEVVPVLGGRTQAADGRIKIVHALGHGITGGIGVKAAIDRQASGDQRCQPRWVRPGAGGGKAAVIGMKGMATKGVDSGLAENDRVAGRVFSENRRLLQN
jgi:hypothetical protein